MRCEFRELETRNLRLRKVETEDTQILWNNFYKDYEKYKFYEWGKIENYDALKEKIANQIKRYDDGYYFRWAIVLKETGQLIGNINLHHYSGENNNIKIGYFIFDNYRNKGYASESALKVIEFAFNELKVHRITGSAIAGNIASNRVLLKTGFTLEGIRKEDQRIGGRYYDSHIYGLLNTKEEN